MSSCKTADCRAVHARVTEIQGASAMNPDVFENGRGVTILLRPTDREYSRLEIIEGLVGTGRLSDCVRAQIESFIEQQSRELD
jgi:hypothetical protein